MYVSRKLQNVRALTNEFRLRYCLTYDQIELMKNIVTIYGTRQVTSEYGRELIKAEYFQKNEGHKAATGKNLELTPREYYILVDLLESMMSTLDNLGSEALPMFLLPEDAVVDGSSQQKKGICPECGEELEWGDGSLHEIDNNSTKKGWRCENCGAEGTEWCDIVFDHHEDLEHPNDGPAFTEEELEKLDLKCGETCPVCGGELEFHGDQHIVFDKGNIGGDITKVGWTCATCGISGTEVCKVVFSEHILDD